MSIELSNTELALGNGLSSASDLESQVHRFVDRAVFFANQTRNPQDIHDAWRTFRVWLSSWIDYNSDDWRLFLVWYVFHWQPPGTKEDPSEYDCSIAEQFARELPEEVSAAERKVIDLGTVGPMDFYEIHALPELECFYVKSLLLGYQQSFAFKQLPKELQVGDVFFGKIIQFRDDQGALACHSRPFPASAKVSIAYLRRQLISGRKEEFIKNFPLFDTDLFNLYHDLLNQDS